MGKNLEESLHIYRYQDIHEYIICQQKDYTQESGVSKSQAKIGQERSIQLIRYIPNQNLFEFNEEGQEFLRNVQGDLGFAVVCGKYRTGKSFLLNRLLDAQGDGVEIQIQIFKFKVDPATTSCTQGIWMYTKPLYNSLNGMQIFFLDTEGSESIDRSTTHDAKIFALAILMSSYFIFNSVGCIDEQSISQLQLTTTLAKNIQIQESHSQNDPSGLGNESLIGYYTPKFIWILRDFVLEIQDRQGRRISSKEYLENALNDESTSQKTSEVNRRIRKYLLQFFRDRDCITMIRPVNEESNLQQLNKLPNGKLRKEFVQQISYLRDLLIKNCPPKQMNGVNLNGRMYCEMVQNYLGVLNRGGVPNISNAWEYIIEKECIYGYESATQLYQQSLQHQFGQDEAKKFEEIFQLLKVMRDQAYEKFHSIAGIREKNNYYDQYKAKLKDYINQKESLALKLNEDMNNSRNEDLIQMLSHELSNNINNEVYSADDLDSFFYDFNSFLTAYDQQAGGTNKAENLIRFLVSFHPTLIKRLVGSIKKKFETVGHKAELEKEQFKLKEENYRDNISILQEKISVYEAKVIDYSLYEIIQTVKEIRIREIEIRVIEKQSLNRVRAYSKRTRDNQSKYEKCLGNVKLDLIERLGNNESQKLNLSKIDYHFNFRQFKRKNPKDVVDDDDKQNNYI